MPRPLQNQAEKSQKPAIDPLLDSFTIYGTNIHPIITPASPSLASPHFDASFDSVESLTTTFTSLVVPTLETTTVTEDALGYHRNGQYSITAMTSSSGAVAEHYAYTAYGQPTILNASGAVLTGSAVGNRYTYTGREWDEALGLHHFRARWMSRLAGRFLGRDPIGYVGSEWALYEYVDSRPFMFNDPSGLVPIQCQCSRYSHRDQGGSYTEYYVVVDCTGFATSCCERACGSGRFTGNRKLVNAEPDDLGLEDEIIYIAENVVCSGFLVCEVVIPTPGEGVACAAGTKVVCRWTKQCFRMKGKRHGRLKSRRVGLLKGRISRTETETIGSVIGQYVTRSVT